jgi:hypothetical protein
MPPADSSARNSRRAASGFKLALFRAVARLPSAIDITFRPTAAWDAIRAANPHWTNSLLRHALPLALLPAIAWPIGQSASGWMAVVTFTTTLLFSLTSVLLLAAGAYVLAGFFEAARDWDRSVAVAAYASTPVLASWFLLLFPLFAVIPVVALLHGFALCYLGVQQVLECRESEAALLVAAAWVFSALGSLILGGLCSAAGVI